MAGLGVERDVDVDVDVVVIGGGPAGCAVALALAARAPQLSCVVVEHGRRRGVGETLPPGAQQSLARLGLWSAFLADGHLPVHGGAACWGQAEPLAHDYLVHARGCGWHLDRGRFDAMLGAGVDLRRGSGLTLAGGLELRPRFVVDASGRKLAYARTRGVEAVAWDRSVAWFERYRGAGEGPATTLVEAVEHGWCYSARLPGGDLVVAALGDPERRPALGPQTAARIGAGQRVDTWTCDARAQATSQVVGRDWLAVGDAALAADPLSSQGIVAGLAMGSAAAETIVAHLGGDPAALDRYAEALAGLRDRFITARRQTYRRERRFASAPFWRQRQEQITLAPDRRLATQTPPRAGARGLYLPASELADLAASCGAGRPAHEVVRRFQTTHPRADRTVLLALQGLQTSGAVRTA